MDDKKSIRIQIDNALDTGLMFGSLDTNLKIIEEHYNVEIVLRQDEIIIAGQGAKLAEAVISDLFFVVSSGDIIDIQKLEYIISLVDKGLSYKETDVHKDIIAFTHKGKPIKAMTLGQSKYVKSIKSKDIVFGIGPAGTGKTYLAVAMAAGAYKNKDIEKIILTRPAVEAGERLGFLPGDLQEKVDPYLRPLYDALNDVLGREAVLRLREKESIEIVPLAYMRGRTLDNAFIILDEAQNTTKEQMKMFLTRMGRHSKVIVTGDDTQIDLPEGKKSGLTHAIKILSGIKEIDFCTFSKSDVVRHSLVKKIIAAYEKKPTR